MAVLYAVLLFLQKKSKTGCFYRDCGSSAPAADRLADAYGGGPDISLDPLYGNRHFDHAAFPPGGYGYHMENGGLLLYEGVSDSGIYGFPGVAAGILCARWQGRERDFQCTDTDSCLWRSGTGALYHRIQDETG